MAILCWAAKNSLRGTVAGLLRPRLGCASFALNSFSLISEIKWNWILFTCVSLFHYIISLLFFRFFSLTSLQIFASLHFSNFRFEVKQSIAPSRSPSVKSRTGSSATSGIAPQLPVSPPPLPDSFPAEQQRRQQRSIAIVTRLWSVRYKRDQTLNVGCS